MKSFQPWPLLILLTSSAAFWRLTCPFRSGFGRLDPIMSPGSPSKHAHVIHGGGAFGFSATYEDLVSSSCTSCSVVQDKSAYWVPALYFTPDRETFTAVPQIGGLVAYYELLADQGQAIVAYSPGFRMVSGNSVRREFDLPLPVPEKSLWSAKDKAQDALAQKAVGFTCLSPNQEPALSRHFLPGKPFLDANCSYGLRAELMFPSCWNGRDLDSPDHRAHVAYSDLVLGGYCPASFPRRLPSLHYEVTWNTSAFSGEYGTFVFANGDTTGFGFHGDFMNGWEVPILQEACDSCQNLSGKIEDCAVFEIQDDDVSSGCSFTVPTELKGEDCLGPRSLLPGNLIIN